MRRAIVVVALSLAVLAAGFIAVVAMQPADFRIARSATIAAPPEAVFAQIDDLRRWQAWSPWARRDPAMKTTFEGPPAGVGAIYRWTGNDQVGEGSMTIVESRPGSLVRLELRFARPMQATNAAEFALSPQGDRTHVTWTMTGRNGFLAKAFALAMDMDALVGADFEQGLANLALVATAPAAPAR